MRKPRSRMLKTQNNVEDRNDLLVINAVIKEIQKTRELNHDIRDAIEALKSALCLKEESIYNDVYYKELGFTKVGKNLKLIK